MTPDLLAESALALVGVPFRLHGRDPATGLDCIGVLAAALRGCGITIHLPGNYGLRSLRLPDFSELASELGFTPAKGAERRGDVLFVRPCPVQFHLLIALGSGECVHAHVGLRRVVRSPRPEHWPVEQLWRITNRTP